MIRALSPFVFAASFALALGMAGCVAPRNGGGQTDTPPPLSVSVSPSTLIVPQDGTPTAAQLTIVSPATTATVAVSGLPGGIGTQYSAPSTTASGTLTLTASKGVSTGNYNATVLVTSASQTASTTFTLVVAAVAKVGSATDTSLGVKGVLKQFMATSFQIAEWTGNYFGTGATANARETTLTSIGSQHVRLQALSQAIPMKANSGASTDWDFTLLDQTVQPVLASADNSPEFQIAAAPAWMCLANGYLDIDNHLKDFADYSAQLVRYYNAGGFNYGGKHFQSPSNSPITWWGVFNEYNINGLTSTQYVTLYNAVVPAMLAVDPTIKFSALEFSDSDLGFGGSGDPMGFLPAFVAPANGGGVKAQVDVASTHLYGSCNQRDTDGDVFYTAGQFAANVSYFYQQLARRTDLANVEVWVTENNVNADYETSNGMSACNPTHHFVTDPRGTSAFFAAWRPYVFSRLGKAGNQALYHWAHTGDLQFGEVDGNGNPYLSYWVDRALANYFPSTPSSPGPRILTLTSTDTSSIEVLATQRSNGTVVLMIVDLAVHGDSDNNGAGDPRTVIVDLSGLTSYTAASLMTIDATTSTVTGPAAAGVMPASRMTVTLNGYGVAFLQLTP